MARKTQRSNDDSARDRQRMVDHQIRARDIRDPHVLKVMGDLPRERFIPKPWRSSAYDDRAVTIGLDQTISQPYMVALMTERLRVTPAHAVLEIGTGSGYQTAILARLARHVYTIERLSELSHRAEQTLADLDIINVTFRIDDGTVGWAEFAPYDRIMVTAGAPHVPAKLLEQLTDDGILIVPVGPEGHQSLLRVRKSAEGHTRESIVGCRFVKLLGQDGWADDEGPH